MKDNGDDIELMSDTGSTGDDSSCHPLNKKTRSKSILKVVVTTFITASLLAAAGWAAFTVASDGGVATGVSYKGEVLSVSDSRLVVGAATVVGMLTLKTLWNMVEGTLTWLLS